MAEATATVPRVDALAPAEMAERCENVGVAKAALDGLTTLGLAILAGGFIALGGVFMTTVTAGAAVTTAAGAAAAAASAALPFGLSRLLGGLAFCLGLILVVVAGAELFTGNNLIVMACMSGKVSLRRLLRNWGIVYLGNLIGAAGTAGLMFLTRQYTFAGGALGANALSIAAAKSGLGFVQAVTLGILCNALVCLAVWLTYSARSVADKILAILFPITAFVAAGFEHSIANMYFIPLGLLIKWLDPAFVGGLGKAVDPARLQLLTVPNMLLGNLLPVTLGNIVGGAGLVGLVYWFIYLRPRQAAQALPAPCDEQAAPEPILQAEPWRRHAGRPPW